MFIAWRFSFYGKSGSCALKIGVLSKCTLRFGMLIPFFAELLKRWFSQHSHSLVPATSLSRGPAGLGTVLSAGEKAVSQPDRNHGLALVRGERQARPPLQGPITLRWWPLGRETTTWATSPPQTVKIFVCVVWFDFGSLNNRLHCYEILVRTKSDQ